MAMQIKRRPAAAAAAAAAADWGADLHPVLRRVYAARGVARDEDLDLSLERLLPVTSLEGVLEAARLLASHQRGGRVLVIGDFDADGATGSALLVRGLKGS